MTWIDVLLLTFAIAFIGVMMKTADNLFGAEDEDGYNLERGSKNDDT